MRATAEEQREKSYWLALSRLPGIGSAKFKNFLTQFPLSSWFHERRPTSALLDVLKRLCITPAFDWEKVESDLRWAEQPQQHIITYFDEAFPPMLREIPDHPSILYVKGDIACLKTFQLGMVGSRHPTATGQEHAFHFAKALAESGLTITSGLAAGIDGFSHRGALAAKGKTVAILGHGLHSVYPASHRALASQILDQQGALVSEFPLESGPDRWHFPKRNRIISGLSLGVLVVEATLKSGSLITADYALEQGREVFAIPGSLNNPLAKGCLHLIRQGAKCVETVDHVLEELGQHFSVPHVSNDPLKNSVKKEKPTSQTKEILRQMGDESTPIDLLVQRTGLSSSLVSTLLMELELRGTVALVPGGYVRT